MKIKKLISLIIGISFFPNLAIAKDEIIFGVMPYTTPSHIEKSFAPLIKELTKALQQPVIFRTRSSYEKFRTSLLSNDYDIAFLNPFDYGNTARFKGYTPLVKFSKNFPAVFLTPIDSPINNLQDLRGKKISLPPTNATYALLAKQAVLKSGLNPYTDVQLVYAKSHQSAIQKVVLGEVPVAAVFLPEFIRAKKNLDDDLRPFYYTRLISPILIAVGPSIGEKERAILLSVLSNADSPAMKAFYKNINGSLGYFTPADETDFLEFIEIWEELVANGESCCKADTESQ